MRMELSQIRRDGNTQSRAAIDRKAVTEYAQSMMGGEQFPPIVVFFDGQFYWMGDGFHRTEAALLNGYSDFEVDIRKGGRREAYLFNIQINDGDKVRVTAEDKRYRIKMFLIDSELAVDPETGSPWSDRAIARLAKVSHTTVGAVRQEIQNVTGQMASDEVGDSPLLTPPPNNVTGNSLSDKRTYISKSGKKTSMKVAKAKPKPKWPRFKLTDRVEWRNEQGELRQGTIHKFLGKTHASIRGPQSEVYALELERLTLAPETHLAQVGQIETPHLSQTGKTEQPHEPTQEAPPPPMAEFTVTTPPSGSAHSIDAGAGAYVDDHAADPVTWANPIYGATREQLEAFALSRQEEFEVWLEEQKAPA